MTTKILGYLTFATLGLLASLTTSGLAQSPEMPDPEPEGMAILGTAIYQAKPEKVTFVGFLETQADTSTEAQAVHGPKQAKLIAVLDQLGSQGLVIEQTRFGTVRDQPLRYSQDEGISAEDRLKVVYTTTSFYQFSMTDLSILDEVVSALTRTDILLRNINFSALDERAAYREARGAAARDALDQAKVYADALGIDLLNIRTVTDGDVVPSRGEADLMTILATDVRVSVPEFVEYRGRVTVIWDIGFKQP